MCVYVCVVCVCIQSRAMLDLFFRSMQSKTRKRIKLRFSIIHIDDTSVLKVAKTQVCVYVCMCVCMYVCVCVQYMYVCECACVCVCVLICADVCARVWYM